LLTCLFHQVKNAVSQDSPKTPKTILLQQLEGQQEELRKAYLENQALRETMLKQQKLVKELDTQHAVDSERLKEQYRVNDEITKDNVMLRSQLAVQASFHERHMRALLKDLEEHDHEFVMPMVRAAKQHVVGAELGEVLHGVLEYVERTKKECDETRMQARNRERTYDEFEAAFKIAQQELAKFALKNRNLQRRIDLMALENKELHEKCEELREKLSERELELCVHDGMFQD
jgi:hypothetical protein